MSALYLALLMSGPVVEDANVHLNLAYTDPADPRQKLDVYAPTQGKNHPIVIWIHGGGWQAGDKKEVKHKPQAFVNRGFVFVSVNYRLLPKASIRQMAEDVARAIRWVHDHARDYRGDPNTLLVMGHSAGAQLAALVCTDASYLKAEKLPLSLIKACVPVDGDTYDVPLQIRTVEPRRARIYRDKFGDEDSQKELSPITHVAGGKSIPPMLVLHVAEHPETKLQSDQLVKALQEAGVSATTYPAAEKDHVTLNDDLGSPEDQPSQVLFTFLDRALKRRTLSHFTSHLSRKLTPASAENAFGKPDADLGSGLMIYKYTLTDESIILLGFPGQAPIRYARHLRKDGKVDDLPLR